MNFIQWAKSSQQDIYMHLKVKNPRDKFPVTTSAVQNICGGEDKPSSDRHKLPV